MLTSDVAEASVGFEQAILYFDSKLLCLFQHGLGDVDAIQHIRERMDERATQSGAAPEFQREVESASSKTFSPICR